MTRARAGLVAGWATTLALPALVAVAVAAVAVPGGGCGGDDCTRGDDHTVECMPPMSSSSGGTTMAQACAGVRLCQSQCINQFTCAQITGNDPAFSSCMNQCKGK